MTINTLFQILFLNYFLGCWSRIWFDLFHGDSRVWRHWSPWSDCWREKRYCEWLNHYSPFSEFNALYYSGHRWEQAGLHQAGLSNEDDWSDQEAVICLPWGILWHYSQKVNTIFRLNLLTKISNFKTDRYLQRARVGAAAVRPPRHQHWRPEGQHRVPQVHRHEPADSLVRLLCFWIN